MLDHNCDPSSDSYIAIFIVTVSLRGSQLNYEIFTYNYSEWSFSSLKLVYDHMNIVEALSDVMKSEMKCDYLLISQLLP